MLADPLKDTPPIVLAVSRRVAEEALPTKAAVIVPAEKLPDASLATIVLAEFALVASREMSTPLDAAVVPHQNGFLSPDPDAVSS